MIDQLPVVEKTQRDWRKRAVHLARSALLLVVLAAAVYAVVRNWSAVEHTAHELSWSAWLPSFLVLPCAILASTMSWQTLVDEIGEPIGARRGAQIFLVGQLGKYLPGSVWAYVLQIELGRRAGLARARIFTATVFSIAVAVVAALLTGSLAIPSLIEENPSLAPLRWLYLLLPIGLFCLAPPVLSRIVRQGFRILRRPQPSHPVRKRAVLESLGWAMLSYAFFGLHLWFLLRGVAHTGVSTLPLCIGTMATGMIASLFFFILPSGAGIREVILVAALGPFAGTGTAVALAAFSRVLLTIADLSTAGIAAGVAQFIRAKSGPYHGDPGIESDEA